MPMVLVPSYARGKGRVKRNPLISIGCARGSDGWRVVRELYIANKFYFINHIEAGRGLGCAYGEIRQNRLAAGYAVNAHVWAQYFGNNDRTVGLLIILDNRDPSTADGQARTV